MTLGLGEKKQKANKATRSHSGEKRHTYVDADGALALRHCSSQRLALGQCVFSTFFLLTEACGLLRTSGWGFSMVQPPQWDFFLLGAAHFCFFA